MESVNDKKITDLFVVNPAADFDYFESLGTGTSGKILACKLRSTDPTKIKKLGTEYLAVKLLSKYQMIKDRWLHHMKNEIAHTR